MCARAPTVALAAVAGILAAGVPAGAHPPQASPSGQPPGGVPAGELGGDETGEPATRGARPGRAASDALAAVTDPGEPSWSGRRQVVLYPDGVEFRRGNDFLGRLRFAGGDTTLPEIAELLARIDRQDWVQHLGGGTYLLRAALVQAPGSGLTIAAPAVREVRLSHAYLAGTGARATLRDVTVTSWDEAAGTPQRTPRRGRPFVLYQRGSTLDVAGSELAYLGSGRAKGEAGVTWSLAAGRVSDTVFHHNHQGATLDRAAPVDVGGSTFRDNADHGLAAVGPSTGLAVTGSAAAGNGGHGLLVRNQATGAALRDNRATGNAAHGIVLDQGADRAVLEGNHAKGNGGDGLVLRGVAHARVAGNTVSGNRVGLRVDQRSTGALLERNQVSGNEVGVELYGGTRGTRLVANHVTDSGRVGLLLEATGTLSQADQVRGAPVGVHVRDRVTLERTRVAGAERGVVVTDQGTASLRDVTVDAATDAVSTRQGGVTRVRGSTLQAPVPLRGADDSGLSANTLLPTVEPPRPDLPARPVRWLALAGVGCILSAVALQVLHRVRNRGRNRPEEPRHAT